jgi:hypothetical protein
MGLIDVYAAVLPDFPYNPGIHVHYQESTLPLKDGLPKMQDLPKEMGGSGVTVNESKEQENVSSQFRRVAGH